MRVTSLRLVNFRSFEDSETIKLGHLNVLIGANNSGKSSVIRALHQMQEGIGDTFADVRSGSQSATVQISLDDISDVPRWSVGINERLSGDLFVDIATTDRRSGTSSLRFKPAASSRDTAQGDLKFPGTDPRHFVVPYLSKRKSVNYSEDVREKAAMAISSDLSNLAAKLSRISNPQFPKYEQYARSCKEILGFVITAIPSTNGLLPGTFLPNGDGLPIAQMGEGVANVVQMLVNLVTSKKKLFLVEEPENDLHPRALKALLNLMIESAKDNQFVVSTHSNIVVQHLCSAPQSRLYRISVEEGEQPAKAKIEHVPEDSQARLNALSELGYALSDFDLWDGWLILEESSAERIIRSYLIPWFAPGLNRLRTMSANGVDKVESSFADFNRLVLFTHLQPLYLNKAWVRVDGDERGKTIVDNLRKNYSGWTPGNFSVFDQPQFERYYPTNFSDKVDEVLVIQEKAKKRAAKKQLLDEVIAWVEEDHRRAKEALRVSAQSVISDLQSIEQKLSTKQWL